MKEVKNILIACNGYPPFTKVMVEAFLKAGVSVTVIGPQSLTKHFVRHVPLVPKYTEEKRANGAILRMYRPYTISLGRRFEKQNLQILKRTVNKCAKCLSIKPDICLGEFWHWTYTIYPYAKKNTIPLFCQTGEQINLDELVEKEDLDRFCDYLSGVISVSTRNINISIYKGLLKVSCPSIMLPNGVDDNFKVKKKSELRQKHNISADDFIIAFVGWYSVNKGLGKLCDAINLLNDDSIKAFFIGDPQPGSDFKPNCKGILHTGNVSHENISEYLNMADVFVLPTLMEGCSNAVIEALSCGLPVISSDRDFNWDVCTKENSILVDPLNAEEIAAAIRILKDSPELRSEMSKAALEAAKSLSIDVRVKKILEFVNNILSDNRERV